MPFSLDSILALLEKLNKKSFSYENIYVILIYTQYETFPEELRVLLKLDKYHDILETIIT